MSNISLEQLFSIQGRVAVVTGGSRGIGEMIARTFAQLGARVYITSRKAAELEAAAASISEVGECIAIPSDLGAPEGCSAFATAFAEREPRLDILVNNAGATWGAPIDEYPESGFDKVLDLNVRAVFQLTRLLLPRLRAAASAEAPARVINIGSVDGLKVPRAESYAYSASKAAVHMLTRHLASRLVGEHINVNAIAPGLFPSKMTRFWYESPEIDHMIQAIPMGRDGSQADIGGTAVFLSSRAGAYLTGVVIPVSGGLATIT